MVKKVKIANISLITMLTLSSSSLTFAVKDEVNPSVSQSNTLTIIPFQTNSTPPLMSLTKREGRHFVADVIHPLEYQVHLNPILRNLNDESKPNEENVAVFEKHKKEAIQKSEEYNSFHGKEEGTSIDEKLALRKQASIKANENEEPQKRKSVSELRSSIEQQIKLEELRKTESQQKESITKNSSKKQTPFQNIPPSTSKITALTEGEPAINPTSITLNNDDATLITNILLNSSVVSENETPEIFSEIALDQASPTTILPASTEDNVLINTFQAPSSKDPIALVSLSPEINPIIFSAVEQGIIVVEPQENAAASPTISASDESIIPEITLEMIGTNDLQTDAINPIMPNLPFPASPVIDINSGMTGQSLNNTSVIFDEPIGSATALEMMGTNDPQGDTSLSLMQDDPNPPPTLDNSLTYFPVMNLNNVMNEQPSGNPLVEDESVREITFEISRINETEQNRDPAVRVDIPLESSSFVIQNDLRNSGEGSELNSVVAPVTAESTIILPHLEIQNQANIERPLPNTINEVTQEIMAVIENQDDISSAIRTEIPTSEQNIPNNLLQNIVENDSPASEDNQVTDNSTTTNNVIETEDLMEPQELAAVVPEESQLVNRLALVNNSITSESPVSSAASDSPSAFNISAASDFSEDQALKVSQAGLDNHSSKMAGTSTIISSITRQVDTRLNMFTNSPGDDVDMANDQDITTGASSGDEYKYPINIWTQVFKGFGKQSAYEDVESFKSNHSGAIIGVDTLLNDKNLIGVAYSYGTIKTKFNTLATSKMETYVITGYLSSYFTNALFLNSQIKYGKLHFKNSSASNMKTKGDAFNLKGEFGYNINCKNGLIITPSLGLSFDRLDIKKYSNDQIAVPNSNTKHLTSITGINIAKSFTFNEMSIVPSIHAHVETTLNHKVHMSKVSNLDKTIDSTYTPSKPQKNTFSLGGDLEILAKKNIEIEFGYDSVIRKKFISHTGSFKFKVIL